MNRSTFQTIMYMKGSFLSKARYQASILYKSTAGRYRPVSYPDGPITARYRLLKNASWVYEWGRFQNTDSHTRTTITLKLLFHHPLPLPLSAPHPTRRHPPPPHTHTHERARARARKSRDAKFLHADCRQFTLWSHFKKSRKFYDKYWQLAYRAVSVNFTGHL